MKSERRQLVAQAIRNDRQMQKRIDEACARRELYETSAQVTVRAVVSLAIAASITYEVGLQEGLGSTRPERLSWMEGYARGAWTILSSLLYEGTRTEEMKDLAHKLAKELIAHEITDTAGTDRPLELTTSCEHAEAPEQSASDIAQAKFYGDHPDGEHRRYTGD